MTLGDGTAFFDGDFSRSPSPAPSSGVESNSFKESPMQIDMLSSDGTNMGEFIIYCVYTIVCILQHNIMIVILWSG